MHRRGCLDLESSSKQRLQCDQGWELSIHCLMSDQCLIYARTDCGVPELCRELMH